MTESPKFVIQVCLSFSDETHLIFSVHAFSIQFPLSAYLPRNHGRLGDNQNFSRVCIINLQGTIQVKVTEIVAFSIAMLFCLIYLLNNRALGFSQPPRILDDSEKVVCNFSLF
jgi:hypothetical protein